MSDLPAHLKQGRDLFVLQLPQPEQGTIIPEEMIGYGRRGQALKEVVLCVDQSGSMASSVVYAGVFRAVMASLKSI